MNQTLTKPTEVTLTRDIKAPVERVYALWLDRDAVVSWFGMDGFINQGCEIDPRPGGAWHVASRTPDGQDFRMEGTFLEIEPQRRILQNWCHVGSDGTRGNVTEVEITFRASDTGTRLTIHHRNIAATPEMFELGWTQSLGKIEALLAA